jgi:hypothetical protein
LEYKMKTRLVFVAATSALALLSAPRSAHAILMYATSGNDIATFDTGATGVVSSVPVTGLQGGESLVGIDTRPANEVLYAIGSSSRLYTINPVTGLATAVGSAGAFTINGTSFAVDFIPTADRIRLISNTGQNLRINPNDGTLTATDTAITPAGVTITGGAYDRNNSGFSATTLYGIDSTNGVLTTVGSVNGSPNTPNGGVVGPTVGSLGLGTALDPRIGFDITGANNASAFATILTGGTDKLYSVNLSTGAATLVGTIGTGTTVYNGVTAASATPEPGTIGLAGLAAVGVLLRRRRAGILA